MMKPLLSGSFTIDDDKLFTLLKELADAEGLFLEPSALAGMLGPIKLVQEGNHYLKANNLAEKMNNATHIIWGTGGSMVPEEEMMAYYRRGGTIK
jgi:D-serine dehydratase